MERLNESRIGAVVSDAFAVRASTSTMATLHAQHGVAALVGLESDVTVTEPGGAPVRGRVLLVPPDCPHAVTCAGPMLGFLYDPEAMPRVADLSRLRGHAHPLEPALAARIGAAAFTHRASLSRPEVLDGLARELATCLANEAPRRPWDPRIARIVAALRDPRADKHAAVARAGLSEAHLQALFARDVGLPMRTSQLWRRLLAGVAALARVDATTAAHAAGFADLAHFSRTCRRMLGYSPTELGRGLLGE